jgi:hypothetical protein
MPRKSVKGALIDQSVFSPHVWPKFELCIHFEDKPGESGEAAQRGINLHELLAAVLAGELKIEDIEDLESRECVAWAVDEIDRRGINIRYVEYEVEITDAGFGRFQSSASGKPRSSSFIISFETREVRIACTKPIYQTIISGMAGGIKSADFFGSIWFPRSFSEVPSRMYEIPDLPNCICSHSSDPKRVKPGVELQLFRQPLGGFRYR